VIRRPIVLALLALLAAGLALAACHKNPASETPVDEHGSPVYVDIGGGQFKLTKAYYDLALERAGPIFRGQFETPAGKRDYLDRLVYEAVYYLEGLRKKYDRKTEFKNLYNLRLFQGVLDEFRSDLRKKLVITDDQLRAEYDRLMKGKAGAKPFETMKTAVRNMLEMRLVEEAYQAKKQGLLKDWQIKYHYDLLNRLLPSKPNPDDVPRLDEVLAEGANGYKYTVGQLAKRIEELPEEVKQRLRQPGGDAKARLEFVVGVDVLFTWAVREGLDKTASYQLRKLIIEVVILSQITRAEIIGNDIVASGDEAKRYYDLHKHNFTRSNGQVVPFEEVRAKILSDLTEHKRLDAMKSLAKSLMAHRFPTVYYEANIKKYLIGAPDAH
jgi:hypothetical protein